MGLKWNWWEREISQDLRHQNEIWKTEKIWKSEKFWKLELFWKSGRFGKWTISERVLRFAMREIQQDLNVPTSFPSIPPKAKRPKNKNNKKNNIPTHPMTMPLKRLVKIDPHVDGNEIKPFFPHKSLKDMASYNDSKKMGTRYSRLFNMIQVTTNFSF